MEATKYEQISDTEESVDVVGRRESRQRRYHNALLFAGTVLLALNAMFLAWNIFKPARSKDRTALWDPNDQPPQNAIPDFPREVKFFDHVSEYTDISEDSNVLWENILPIGVGYFTVEDPRSQNMPESRPAPNSTVGEKEEYLVTFAHQLHCLAVVREMLLAHENGVTSMFEGGHHQFHCLDKLRQAIMCHADTALEVGHPRKDDDGNVVSWYYTDWQQPHQCKNWEAVKDWFYKHRANDKQGLLVI